MKLLGLVFFIVIFMILVGMLIGPVRHDCPSSKTTYYTTESYVLETVECKNS